jgi:hypothetical protein
VVDLVGDGEQLSESREYQGYYWGEGEEEERTGPTTALEEAVRGKNLPAVYILLKNGARPSPGMEGIRGELGLEEGWDRESDSDILALYTDEEREFV